MNENYAKENNYGMLHGFVNGVVINNYGKNAKAINLLITTVSGKKGEDGKLYYSDHDAACITGDKATIEKFEEMAKSLENNKANKGVEGFKKESFPIEVRGSYNERNRKLVLYVKPENIIHNPKPLEAGQPGNIINLKGNIADVMMYPDKDFALVNVIHDYTKGKGEKAEKKHFSTDLLVDRKLMPEDYAKLQSDELGKGDLIVFSAKRDKDSYVNEAGKTVYTDRNVAFNIEVRASKKEKREAAAKQAAETKQTEKKVTKKTQAPAGATEKKTTKKSKTPRVG